jgi:hypothetical protein
MVRRSRHIVVVRHVVPASNQYPIRSLKMVAIFGALDFYLSDDVFGNMKLIAAG